jgi:hypothetical protein
MLTLCTVCSRHARADEACCPFCRGPLAPPKPARKVGRGGRAALLFGTALTIAASGAGCGGGQSTESTTPDEERTETPPPSEGGGDTGGDGGGDTGGDGGGDVGSPVAMYGVPAPE